MTLLDSQICTKTRSRARRLSACYRHPAELVTGFCALCLRDRLAGLHPSPHLEPSSLTKHRGVGVGAASTIISRHSVSAAKSEVFSRVLRDPRRKSCDARVRNSTLSDLFSLDDSKSGGPLDRDVKVESKNLGFSRIAAGPLLLETRTENENRKGIRAAEDDNNLVRNPNVGGDGDAEIEEELKTMKEHIDLEWLQYRKHANIWEAASVFSQKLRKWRQKKKKKKATPTKRGSCHERTNRRPTKGQRQTLSEIADFGFGRRSCDTEPRFSVDANRMSVDYDSRFSFDEQPRASWDGYLIARTIPRLTPMHSIVDNVMLTSVNRSDKPPQMHWISEDGVNSNSGESATKSNSDSSSSLKPSSSDCLSFIKSSGTKTLGLEADSNDVIFHETKLVITERELKDWHLSSLNHSSNLENVESDSNDATSMTTGSASNAFKRETASASRWRKVFNLWSYRLRLGDMKHGDLTENGAGENLGSVRDDGVEKGDSTGKLIHNSRFIGSKDIPDTIGSHQPARGCAKKGIEEIVLERNMSASYSTSDLDSGLLRFYLTPFRNYRRSKSGKGRVKNSPSMARNGILLN